MRSQRWTRDGLAASTGISQGVLTQYRAGRDMAVGDAMAIARAMGITLPELLTAVYGHTCDEQTAVAGAFSRLPDGLKKHFLAVLQGVVDGGER